MSKSSINFLYCNILLRHVAGKGDLVGSDINLHLQHSTNGPAGVTNTGGNQDIIIKSSSDVRALTYCDLKCINMLGLVDVLRLYPEYQQEFANDIQHDLTFNVREGYEAEVSHILLHNLIKVFFFFKSYTTYKTTVSKT